MGSHLEKEFMMRQKRSLFLIFFHMAIFAIFSPGTGDAYIFTPENVSPGPGTLYLSQNAALSVGTTLAVDVKVNALPAATPAFAAAIDLNYDPSILTFQGFNPGDFFEATDLPENGTMVRLVSQPVLVPGKLVIGISQNSGDPGASGDGILLTLKFTVEASAAAAQGAMTFVNMSLIDPLGVGIPNLAWFGGSVSQTPLAVLTSALPDATVGRQYAALLSASGGFPPYTWRFAGNGSGFAKGVTMNGTTGVVSGNPTTAGAYSGTLVVQDSTLQEVSRPFSFVVNPPPVIVATTLPSATRGQWSKTVLIPSGGTSPYVWSVVSGTLPPGVTLKTNSGTLSGTPTAAGVFSFTIGLLEFNGARATQAFSLTVNDVVAITTQTLPQTTAGALYSSYLRLQGGTPPYRWEVPAGFPPGLTLVPDTGEILGISSTPGSWQFTVGTRDQFGSTASANLTILVNSAPSFLLSSLSSLRQGTLSGQTVFAVSGGIGPFNWNIASGSLPPGMSLNGQTGAASGTPTVPGIFTFTLRVTDGTGVSSDGQYAWVILADPPGNIDFSSMGSESRVDGYDLAALEKALGATSDSPHWNPMADLEGNGIIDGMDLSILSGNFGESNAP
jgi:hypothetical protein